MNPIKSLVVVLFVTTSALAANAQERYEQMTIMYYSTTRLMRISTDTGEYKEEVTPKSGKKDSEYDLSPALVKCRELSEMGWELYQTSMHNTNTYVFHLRRPLK